jgi:predicted O-methyltransferase YrrM
MTPIHLRNVPPPPEVFKHQDFLAFMARWIRPERYLELGVREGISLWAVAPYCRAAIGVDLSMSLVNPNLPKLPQIRLLEMTTDAYFAQLSPNEMFDMVFIDADHKAESVLKDFYNVAPHVINDGFIFLHDSYPCSEEMMAPYYCNDCWQATLHLKQNCIDDFEILTLPFNPGVTVIKKMKRNKQVIYK